MRESELCRFDPRDTQKPTTLVSVKGVLQLPSPVSKLRVAGAYAKEAFRNQQIECLNYAHEQGIDKLDILSWKWLDANAETISLVDKTGNATV